MGSFATTCCISGLPIHGGDDVRWFSLVQNPCNERPVSMHDVWFPRSWPVRAKYNDYGVIEDYDVSTPSVRSFIEGLKNDMVELAVGDNKYHDVPTIKGMSFAATLESIFEGRLSVTTIDSRVLENKVLQVDQGMIHNEVWNALIKERFRHTAYYDGDKYESRVVGFAEFRDDVQKVWDKTLELEIEKNVKLKTSPHEDIKRLLFELKMMLDDTNFKSQKLGQWMTSKSVIPFTYGLSEHYRAIVQDQANNVYTAKQIDDLLDDIAGFSVIHYVCMEVRHWWHPSHICGPQYGDYSKHNRYFQVMKDVSKKLKKEKWL